MRYADGNFMVSVSSTEEDARHRFLDTMRERLQEFALSLHPEGPAPSSSGRLAAENRKRRGAWQAGKPSPSWASSSSAAKLAPG